MGKFDAGTAVEAMEYDFTAYGGGAGIFPEPTNDDLNAFFGTLGSLKSEYDSIVAKMKDAKSDAEVEAIASDEVLGNVMSQMETAISNLSQGRITIEELQALPFRIKQAFINWLTGELSPEAKAPAITR